MPIPMAPQNNPENYPKWSANALPGHSGHPWPKLITKKFTEADRVAWLVKNKRTDVHTRAEYYDERVPAVGAIVAVTADDKLIALGLAQTIGEPVVVRDEEEQARSTKPWEWIRREVCQSRKPRPRAG